LAKKIADTKMTLNGGSTYIGIDIGGTTLELSLARLGENAPLVGAAVLMEVPESEILH